MPSIWPLEVANGLRSAERRGRITIADSARVRHLLLSLPIHVEPVDLGAALTEVADLARTFDLSAYDAAYLALAARHGLSMATADDRLTHACTQAGVDRWVTAGPRSQFAWAAFGRRAREGRFPGTAPGSPCRPPRCCFRRRPLHRIHDPHDHGPQRPDGLPDDLPRGGALVQDQDCLAGPRATVSTAIR